jgi:hypothetical protein
MDVMSITSVPPDPQVSYENRREHDGSIAVHVTRILPLNTSLVGELTFNPAIGCGNQCYLGISPNSTSEWEQYCHMWGNIVSGAISILVPIILNKPV